jgi:hypothetical protein
MPQQADQPAVVETTSQPTPNVAVAPVAPNTTSMVAPPNGGPLPPSLSLPSLGNVVPGQMPSLPTIPSTGELNKKVTEAEKENGPPVAPSALDQLDLKKHMHDFIESEHFWPTVGTGALALAGYGGAKAYQAYKKGKSVQERDIARIEPSFMGGGTETMTASAEREMRNPIIKDGVREAELKSFLNSDKLPTGMDLDLAVKSYLGALGRTSIPANVDLSSGTNFRPGEPVMGSTQATPDNVTGVDYSKPAYLRNKRTAPQTTPVVNPVLDATALNIPTFGEPKNAEQGGVEIPANSDPVHVKEEQDLSSAAQNPQERAQTIDTAKTEVKDAIKPIQTNMNIFDETLPSSAQPVVEGAVPPKEEKVTKAPKTPKEPKVAPLEGLNKAQNSMRNYFIGSQGFTPEQYDEFVTKVYGGKAPEMGPKGGGLLPEDQSTYKGYRKENIEGPKVNLTRDMKKLIKGGSVAALLSLPAFINAKTPEERDQIIRDFGEGLLPIGVTPTEAGAPTLTPAIREAQRQATLLGSPYRKSTGVALPKR